MEQRLNTSNESSVCSMDSLQYTETVENLQYLNPYFKNNSHVPSHYVTDEGTPKILYRSEHYEADSEKPSSSNVNVSTCFPVPSEPDQLRNEALIQKRKTLRQMGFKPDEGNWEQKAEPSKDSLYQLLRRMVEEHVKPDVQICINKITFNCHRMVLECYSEFFMECDKVNLIKLPIEKITPNAFVKVYQWMLADRPQLERKGILEVFNAALFLRIKSLVDQCWKFFDDSKHFCEDTAILLYMEARRFRMETLQKLMLGRVCKFFLTFVASQEFLELNADELRYLLSSNTMGVNSECEIFLAVVRWLDHDWEGRKGNMLKVIDSVRFSLMPPCYLILLNRNHDCEAIARITRDPEVQRLIADGISYSTAKLSFGDKSSQLAHFLEFNKLASPHPRQWISDPGCTYHKREPCTQLLYTSYEQFLEYLDELQQKGKDHWRELEVL